MDAPVIAFAEALLPAQSPASSNGAPVRARRYHAPGTAFEVWVASRPVLRRGARTVLLRIHTAEAPAEALLPLLALADARDCVASAEGLLVYAPWGNRGALVDLIPTLFAANAAAAAERESQLASDLAPLELPSGPAPLAGEGPRFSRTVQGSTARAALRAFAKGAPGVLGRLSTREWMLPMGITLHEKLGLRKATWTLEFADLAVEQRFTWACRHCGTPIEVAWCDFRGSDGGSTEIPSATIVAPVADRETRRLLARTLWHVLNEAWSARRSARSAALSRAAG